MILPLALAGISAAVGAYSAHKQNKTNERIARDTREYNSKLYERQLADTRALRDEDNRYNSPEAQRDRMLRANINPYLNSSVSSVESSSGATPTPAPATPYEYTAPTGSIAQATIPLSMQLAQIEQIKAQTAKIKADTRGVEIDNTFKSPRYVAELKKLGVDTATQELLLAREKFNFQELKDLQPDRVELFKNQVKQSVEMLENLKLDIKLKDFNLHETLPAQRDAVREQIKLTAAQIAQIDDARKLTNAQMQLVFAQTLKTNLEREGIKLANDFAKDTYDIRKGEVYDNAFITTFRAYFGIQEDRDAVKARTEQTREQTRGQKMQNDFFSANKALIYLMPFIKSAFGV